MMKITLLAIFLFFVAFQLPQDSSGQTMNVPSEIEQYMFASNFIASLSTPDERHALSGFDTSEDVLQKTGSERLEKVFLFMKQLKAYEIEIDSDFVVPKSDKRTLSRPSGIHKIKSIHHNKEDSEITVNVAVYHLQDELITHFISAYEKNEPISDFSHISRYKSYLEPEYKVYKWVKVNDNWMKNVAEVYLIIQ